MATHAVEKKHGPRPRHAKPSAKQKYPALITFENPKRGSSQLVARVPRKLPKYCVKKKIPACPSVKFQRWVKYGNTVPSIVMLTPMDTNPRWRYAHSRRASEAAGGWGGDAGA